MIRLFLDNLRLSSFFCSNHMLYAGLILRFNLYKDTVGITRLCVWMSLIALQMFVHLQSHSARILLMLSSWEQLQLLSSFCFDKCFPVSRNNPALTEWDLTLPVRCTWRNHRCSEVTEGCVIRQYPSCFWLCEMLPAALWSDKVEYKPILKIMLNSNFKMIYERGLRTYVRLVFIVEKQHKSIQRAEEQPWLQHKAAAPEPPSPCRSFRQSRPDGSRVPRFPNPVVHGSAAPGLLLRGSAAVEMLETGLPAPAPSHR